MSINRLTATEAAAKIGRGELTREAYVRACLDRIEEREAEVGAWIHLDREGALEAARKADASGRGGPLSGVPFGVKDIIEVAGMPTGLGSPIYTGRVPPASSDAACVALTRRAGGIPLGKTVSTEFANVHAGKTRNPHDLTRTPGGSSSGSAAAVGDGMATLSIGTQTTASTIRPAAYCGVYGFIPTFGLVSASGVRQASGTLDRVGLMARSVADIALFNDVVRGEAHEAQEPRESAPRIGFARTHLWDKVEPATAALLEGAAKELEAKGAPVRDVALPESFAEVAGAHRWVSSYEFVRNFTYEIENHHGEISDALRNGRIADGLSCPEERYLDAISLAAENRPKLDAIFEDHDVLMTVSASGEAPQGKATGEFAFCALWTLLHVPCITIPAFKGPNGMPVGLQLIGRRGRDRALLAAAEWVARKLGV